MYGMVSNEFLVVKMIDFEVQFVFVQLDFVHHKLELYSKVDSIHRMIMSNDLYIEDRLL